MKKKVLVILGPTASGKSALAIKLAKKLGGEIISADSRQVYKGLDIGTGKVTKKEMGGIPHHMIDVVSPKKQFTASEYKELGEKALKKILNKDKLPIVVGGTGFYIDALLGNTSLPDVPPNKLLRSKLNRLGKEELFKLLKKKDPKRAQSIDKDNKMRLIRALEIVESLGKVPQQANSLKLTAYSFIYVGLRPDDLDKKIYKRLLDRLNGIIRECKKLHKQGLTYKRMEELGLEYRYTAMYLQKELTKEEMVEKLYTEIKRYAKRQMTWFKRNKKIKWFTLSKVEGFNPKDTKQIEKYARRVLG